MNSRSLLLPLVPSRSAFATNGNQISSSHRNDCRFVPLPVTRPTIAVPLPA